MKCEPDVYSIDDLQRGGMTCWDGIRNYQARNFMRDQMAIGDGVLFYHSSVKPPGVAGVAEVCREAYPDYTAWEATSPYYDPRSTRESPVWVMVDIRFVQKFEQLIPLEVLRADPELAGLQVSKKGQRLSIQPVDTAHFRRILALAGRSVAGH